MRKARYYLAVGLFAAGTVAAQPRQVGYDDIAKGKLSAKSVAGGLPKGGGGDHNNGEGSPILRWRGADGEGGGTPVPGAGGGSEGGGG